MTKKRMLKMKTPHLLLHHPRPKVQPPPAGCPLLPEWPEVASVWHRLSSAVSPEFKGVCINIIIATINCMLMYHHQISIIKFTEFYLVFYLIFFLSFDRFNFPAYIFAGGSIRTQLFNNLIDVFQRCCYRPEKHIINKQTKNCNYNV